MSDNSVPVAANVLGTIGTVLWCIQLVPQIWYNWKNKKTDGLPGTMMFLWALCAVPFGVYMIVQDVNIPIQIQPQLFGFFALVSWSQILHYNHGWSRLKAIAAVLVLSLLFGGVEAMLIFTLRIPYNKGTTWPILLVGIVATILITLGLLPPYQEIYKRHGRVIGINFVFLGTDFMGALFSLLALVAQGEFDILGGVLYIVVILLEGGIFLCHIIWRFRNRKMRKEAKEKGISIDEALGLSPPSETTMASGPETGVEPKDVASQEKQPTQTPANLGGAGTDVDLEAQKEFHEK